MGEIIAAQTLPAVPLSTWEQIGIVVIFVVFFITMFAAIRWLLNDQRRAQLSSQQALLKQQQEFIERRDQQWQEFLEVQRNSDREAREQDRGAVTKIIDALEKLITEFTSHDTWERTKLDDMQKAITDKPTQPRGRAK